MKNLITIIFSIFVISINYSQIAIGKTSVDGSGLLDFENPSSRGIVLPIIKTLPSNPTNGEFIFDNNDKIVKVYQNDTWINLTQPGDTSYVVENNGVDKGNGIIIGALSSTAKGVLILESEDKSLILPKVNSVDDLETPYPGTICYDLSKKSLAIFDGLNWNYWK